MGHLEAWRAISDRERAAAIRHDVEAGGCPDHLWGLIGWLYGVARDIPYDQRPGDYLEVMTVVGDLFDKHDPANAL